MTAWNSSLGADDAANPPRTVPIEEAVPEGDWIDQHDPIMPEVSDTVPADAPPDVPEADWIDQHRSVGPDPPNAEPRDLPSSVPEADALEQAQPVPLDDSSFADEIERDNLP